jgi:hypothetical protein
LAMGSRYLSLWRNCGVTLRTITFDRTDGFGSNFRILLRSICVKGSQGYSSNQQSDQKLLFAASGLVFLMRVEQAKKCGVTPRTIPLILQMVSAQTFGSFCHWYA